MGSKRVAMHQASSSKAPVVRKFSRISKRWPLAVPQAAGPVEANPRNVILGTDALPAVPVPCLALGDVSGCGRQFGADDRGIIVDELNAPTRNVPAQERDIAAFVQEATNRFADFVAPVLVVTNGKEQFVLVQAGGVAMQV